MKTNLPFKIAPESICILRLSALGDVCNMVPIVRTLRKHWPRTRVTWVIGRVEHQLVGDIEGIEFIEYDKKSGLVGVVKLRKKMVGRRFSVLLQMQSALRASLISLAIPAQIRLGFLPRMAKDFQWLFTHATTKALRHPHVIDGYFSFLAAIGLDQRELVWDIPIPKDARTYVDRRIGGMKRDYLVVSPCASVRFRNWRNWPVRKYAQIIDYAFHRYGLQTILTGGSTEEEMEIGRRIRHHSTHPPVNLIGQTSIKQLLALIERSVAVISPDSGPIHLANAQGVPPIGFYVAGNPLRGGPYLFQKWVVNAYPEAVLKTFGKSVDEVRWGKRVRDPEAIEFVSVAAVKEKIDAVIAERNIIK